MMKLNTPVLTTCILITNIIRTCAFAYIQNDSVRDKSEKILLKFKLFIKKLIQLLEKLGLRLSKQWHSHNCKCLLKCRKYKYAFMCQLTSPHQLVLVKLLKPEQLFLLDCSLPTVLLGNIYFFCARMLISVAFISYWWLLKQNLLWL